ASVPPRSRGWLCGRTRALECYGGVKHFLRAIGKAVNLAERAAPFLEFLKGPRHPSPHRFDRHAGLFPGLDQRPVERRDERRRPARALKALLNFGEVFEVRLFEPTGVWNR